MLKIRSIKNETFEKKISEEPDRKSYSSLIEQVSNFGPFKLQFRYANEHYLQDSNIPMSQRQNL